MGNTKSEKEYNMEWSKKRSNREKKRKKIDVRERKNEMKRKKLAKESESTG